MSTPEEERSPKRQRRSYSPSSPSATDHTKAGIPHQPRTPPPSVRMSLTWSQGQPLPGLGGQQNAGPWSSSGSVTFPTPPSTAGFQSQMMARGASSESGDAGSGQQTPAATENEGAGTRDGDGDAEMSDTPQRAEGGEVGDVSMAENAERRRSDHERQEGDGRGGEDAESALPGVGVLYKLSTESIPPSRPPPIANLLHLYDLEGIQASVARRDPKTGEKINILRKSYAGKVKELGLEGKNKATKGQHELVGLVDPAWDMEYPDGRSAWQTEREGALLGEHDTDKMLSMLNSALDMRPGHLPKQEHERWKADLGLDETATATTTTTAPGSKPLPIAAAPNKTPASNLLAKTAPGAVRNSAPVSPARHPAPSRQPDRAGKKRRYDESSYEGYEDDGYDTSDTQRRGSSGGTGKRQKRKVSGRKSGFYAQMMVPE